MIIVNLIITIIIIISVIVVSSSSSSSSSLLLLLSLVLLCSLLPEPRSNANCALVRTNILPLIITLLIKNKTELWATTNNPIINLDGGSITPLIKDRPTKGMGVIDLAEPLNEHLCRSLSPKAQEASPPPRGRLQ